MNSLAVVMGGHVRVGLEDAIYEDWSSKRLATNSGLIDRVVRLADAAGRKIATAEETRRLIGLEQTASNMASKCA
jgi:3-keto-5-aminohexanoate cleavage enzyme